nr:ORF3 [Torque teno neovison virus]WKF25127.1 ORF3 [Torque teno neovison virus]WKF25130.1 ORF3 [Torque teno neovison virus]WKF25133.1 ORF3 [Torque teno neovison virus]
MSEEIEMSVTPSLSFQKKIAEWKRQCSYTHSLICSCRDFTQHFKWLGYRETNGYASDSATGKVVRGPLDGATITGTGSTSDVEEALDAAVCFQLDDSGLWKSKKLQTQKPALGKKILEKMDSLTPMPGEDLLQVLKKQVDSLILKEQSKRKRRKQTAPYKKKVKIQVPKDPEDPEGSWTEGSLISSSDTDSSY